MRRAPLETARGTSSSIDVVYLEQRPEELDAPFLLEERHLIDSLADSVSSVGSTDPCTATEFCNDLNRACAFCAQLHLSPAHSSLLQPKFGFRANLGWSGPK